MKYIQLLIATLICVIASSCASRLENTVADVDSTKYLEFGKYPVGQGSVFVMTLSYLRKTYPTEDDKIVISNISEKLTALGYSIASSPDDADFVFMCLWLLKDQGASSYTIYDDSIMADNIYLHIMDGTFTKTKGSLAGKDLWNGKNIEGWMHPNLNVDRLSRVLAEKFPN